MKKTRFLVFAFAAFLLGEVIASVWYLGRRERPVPRAVAPIQKIVTGSEQVYYVVLGRVGADITQVEDHGETTIEIDDGVDRLFVPVIIEFTNTGLVVHPDLFDDTRESELAPVTVWFREVKRGRPMKIMLLTGEIGSASPLRDALTEAESGRWESLKRFRLTPSVVEVVSK